MGQRGRKSGAELSVLPGGKSGAGERPAPPDELTKAEAAIWAEIVAAKPAGWFSPEMFGELSQLCRHRVRALRLSQLVADAEAAKPFDRRAYLDLLRAEQENSKLIKAFDTKLRLTPQSKYSGKKNDPTGADAPAPWEE